jgi:hypothetical protein
MSQAPLPSTAGEYASWPARVAVVLTIDEEGIVTAVRVTDSEHVIPSIVLALQRSISSVNFTPGTVRGVSVKCDVPFYAAIAGNGLQLVAGAMQ